MGKYLQLLHEAGQDDQALDLIKKLESSWKAYAHDELGYAAYQSGDQALAQRLFEAYLGYHREEKFAISSKKLIPLIKIWMEQGKHTEAEQLLRECIENTRKEIASLQALTERDEDQEKRLSVAAKALAEFEQLLPTIGTKQ